MQNKALIIDLTNQLLPELLSIFLIYGFGNTALPVVFSHQRVSIDCEFTIHLWCKAILIKTLYLYHSISTTGSLSRERAVEATGLANWHQTGNCSCLLQDALVYEGYTFWQANRLFSDKPALYSTLLLPMRKPFITPSYGSSLSVLPPFPSTFPQLYPSLSLFSFNSPP